MNSRFATAPEPPGALGTDVDPRLLLDYLSALGVWRDRRTAELADLDEAALAASDRDALAGDITLSMALFKAVCARHDELVTLWDSGRVLEAERRRLTTLIWGRLDAAPSGAFGLTLPEGMRLSDTLAGSLRSRLELAGSEPDVDARLRELRAGVERVRDQAQLVPESARAQVLDVYATLDRRLTDVAERARRGADVGGLLPALEADTATAERDLIIGAARRTEARQDVERAQRKVADLGGRSRAVAALAARVRAEIHPAPRLAVPDPQALGEVPTEPDELQAYLTRLERVEAALSACESAYAAPLTRRDELIRDADLATTAVAAALRSDGTAAAAGPGADPDQARAMADDVAELRRRLDQVRVMAPLPIHRLAALACAIRAYADGLAGPDRPTTALTPATGTAHQEGSR